MLKDTSPSARPGATSQDRSPLWALTRSEALARIAMSPHDWLVKDVIAAGDYGVLAGPKGVGKTFAELDLAVSVALGEDWFGRFPCDRRIALVLTAEDSEARIWQRIDAITRSKGHEPDDVEGWLYVHPVPISVITDLERLELEVARWYDQPQGLGLVVLDPAYKYMAGAKTSALFDMGAVLTPLQVVSSNAGAALVVGHHYNRKDGAAREERLSGAGLLEWARFVITVEAPPRRDDEPAVVATFEITGNSLDPVTFRLKRSVRALDESANPELDYQAVVLEEGAAARAKVYRSARDRVLAFVPLQPETCTVRDIASALADDGTPLKEATIRKALSELRRDELVSNDHTTGHHPGAWFRTA